MKDYRSIIQSKYESSFKTFNKTNLKDNKKTSEMFYKSPTYKTIISIMNKAFKKFEKGANKDYYKHVYITQGDYTRRKGYEGSIYDSMKQQALFVKDAIVENPNLKYSLLGVYSDIWDVLNDSKWKTTFYKAFTYAAKEKDNTIANGFKLIYVALVLSFESISFKIVDFKYGIYSGMSDMEAIENIQNKNASLIKNMIMPAIDLIALCKSTSDPLTILNSIIAEEKKGLKSTESYDPAVISDESLFDHIPNILNAGINKITNAGWWKSLTKIFSNKVFLIVSAVIVVLVLAFYCARAIIYYIGIHKVNLEKELEIEAELIENNVNELKEKLNKASSEEEKTRLQNIISKQIDYKNKIDDKARKLEQDDNQANMAIDSELINDEESTEREIETYDNPVSNNNFELEI